MGLSRPDGTPIRLETCAVTEPPESLKTTALNALHRELGARMVPFAGYDMPVQYPAGIMKEHLHTREAASLFDVSHMGQGFLTASGGADVAAALESLVPGDLTGLDAGQTRYTLLLNEAGGILDDLMVTRAADDSWPCAVFLVVNAACKDADFAHIAEGLTGKATLTRAEDRSLLALQGPQAATALARLDPAAATQSFMTVRKATVDGHDCFVSRSGYTGEDGYEISVASDGAEALARRLLQEPEVAPAGLGARDTLRLEAGLCLYGSDIDTETTPIEAALTWVIGKRRRADGGFPGADRILQQLADGPPRRRVGLKPEGRAPARAHTVITDEAGTPIGEVTSGGHGPTVGGPIAMGYVDAAHAKAGTACNLMIRDRPVRAEIVKLPFVPLRYYRG